MKRTKILATYGPAIASPRRLKRLVSLGVNAFRVNCSHGDAASLAEAGKAIRDATAGSEYPVGLLFDLSGPKLRLDRFEGTFPVSEGESFTLTTAGTDLTQRRIAVNHPAIVESLKKGERVFIDDGQIACEVTRAGKSEAVLQVQNPGELLPAKGINLPDTDLPIPTITKKDRADLKTAVAVGADYLALSFVRSGDDIIEAKRLVKRAGGHQKIFAKLEKREAIEQLDEIMLLADGVMIARGDLGVELPAAELPRLQKQIIALANRHHKPVIVATQMLESMRFSPRPTRAEVNDVASAVFDFVDAVMLSAETATGKYPVAAVQTMAEVIRATEAAATHAPVDPHEHLIKSPIPHAIAKAVSRSSDDIDAAAIFAFTTSGYTAAMISNLFPPEIVIALTPDDLVMRQLSLYRSVYPVRIEQPGSFHDMIASVDATCRKYRLAAKGQHVIITGGAPFGSTVPTNFMMIHKVGQ
ncbi:MAG: pyruvate kinase [Candidatus Zixiibacteriota bacterium]|nr:MAG: pyruvate kinase [candidate division Zixibacteria bacterium]